jgi:hypothetical protein
MAIIIHYEIDERAIPKKSENSKKTQRQTKKSESREENNIQSKKKSFIDDPLEEYQLKLEVPI